MRCDALSSEDIELCNQGGATLWHIKLPINVLPAAYVPANAPQTQFLRAAFTPSTLLFALTAAYAQAFARPKPLKLSLWQESVRHFVMCAFLTVWLTHQFLLRRFCE
jgi:hypothetical protein